MTENLNEDNVVEKANSLLFLKDDPFDLTELKILDTYLSRINARNPHEYTVKFTKSEFEKLVGVSKVRPATLKEHASKLIRRIDIKSGDEWESIALFSSSRCYKDVTGQWIIELSCSQEAKKYFFNLEEIGYLRYRLKNIVHMSSHYSVHLYLYLLKNTFRSSWITDLIELKDYLHCREEYYSDYRRFNEKILKRSVSEINSLSNIDVSYIPIRTGRITTALKFTVTIKDSTQANEFPTINSDIHIDNIVLSEFSQIVQNILKIKKDSADRIAKKAVKQELTKEDFTKRIKYAKQKDGIQNIVGYIMSLLENKEWDTPKANYQFNNYHQITYSERFFELIAKQDSCGLTEDEEKEMLSLC